MAWCRGSSSSWLPASALFDGQRLDRGHHRVHHHPAEAAALEDQRLAAAVRDPDDAAEHEVVVAGPRDLFDLAVLRRRGVAHHHEAVRGSGHLRVGERRAGRGQLDRRLALLSVQHAHREAAALAHHGQRSRAMRQRLVAEGRLDTAADVFLLRLDELRAAVADAWGQSCQELVAARTRELEDARAQAPAPWLGDPPAADAAVPPMVAKFYGVPGTASHEGDLIRGTAASAGRATGIARLVRDARDFSRLTAGDVLVSPTTTPAWTPVFTSIGGLVTDSGGILCHAAVVAREYGLPAVVGTDAATRLIPDGALVSVDGTTGEVHIMRRGAERQAASRK